MKQLAIDFEPDITKAYSSCVEYVAARVHQQGILQKSIAADMDLSPSQLSQKLGPPGNSSARLTVCDLERYIEVTDDLEPIKYLIAKFLYRRPAKDIEKQIAELKAQLAGQGRAVS